MVKKFMIYGTDPLNPDTDGDGLLDGSEIKLELDPLKVDTDGNGILDSDEFVLQDVEMENLEHLYNDDNTALPSLEIYGQGDINHTISITDESDNSLLRDLIYIEGYPIDITVGNKFDYATMKFKLANSLDLEEHVIVYFDDNGNIHLLETEIEEDTHSVSTTVNHFSTYFVAHIPTLLHSWGISGDKDEDLSSPIVEEEPQIFHL